MALAVWQSFFACPVFILKALCFAGMWEMSAGRLGAARILPRRSVEFINLQRSAESIDLIVPAFLAHDGRGPQHYPEILGTIGNNLMNKHIGRVHALVEGEANDLHDLCSIFVNLVEQVNKQQLGDVVLNMEKLICIPLSTQATYEVVFRYASALSGNRIVMVANADAAFDDSLNLIDLNYLRGTDVGMVISLTGVGEHDQYKRRFGNVTIGESACANNRCDTRHSKSFDVFVLKIPLRAGVVTNSLDFHMNRKAAEHAAANILTQSGGINFVNPCLTVKVYHWHCSPSTHHDEEPVIKWPFRIVTRPCGNTCPGLRAL